MRTWKGMRLCALAMALLASSLGAPMDPERMRELMEATSRAKQAMKVENTEEEEDEPRKSPTPRTIARRWLQRAGLWPR